MARLRITVEKQTDQRLEITIKNKKPVVLTDLTLSLLAIGQQYEGFIENDVPADQQVSTALLVKEVRTGSIIFELVAQALPIAPLLWDGRPQCLKRGQLFGLLSYPTIPSEARVPPLRDASIYSSGANARFWEGLRFDCSEPAGDDRRQWVESEPSYRGAIALDTTDVAVAEMVDARRFVFNLPMLGLSGRVGIGNLHRTRL